MYSSMNSESRRTAIALLAPSLDGGGAERIMVALANGFVDRGLTVDLVLVKKQGEYLADVDPRVRLVDLGASRTLLALPALVRYLRQHRPHVLIAALNHVNVVATWARALAGTPTRLVVSEHCNLTALLGERRTATQRLLVRLMRATYIKADAIVAVSHGVAEDLSAVLDLPRERVHTLYNPIDVERLSEQSRRPVDHPWLTQGGAPLIVAAGRLTAQKDFPTLIRAFKILRDRGCQARLAILGEGEERPQLEALIQDTTYQDDILLPGFQRNPYAWMRAGAVFVLSSTSEGFANVIVEAMACGTQIVSTACPSGPDEILEGGRWGRLVPVGDVNALARALEESLQSPSVPDVERRAADFNLDKAINAYLQTLCLN